jgi:lactate dehydrogenase-like 2-hydroxyacid dehydrogenase
VVETVVSAALEDSRLAGYAADVFEFEDRPKMQLIRPER